MPQLLIKVPTLKVWGKKLAVVTDEDFFAALERMEEVQQNDNWDVAWFVCKYNESGGEAQLQRGSLHFTSLEKAVQGLTAAIPVDLSVFEDRIRARIQRLEEI